MKNGIEDDHAGGIEPAFHRQPLFGRLAPGDYGGYQFARIAPPGDPELAPVNLIFVGELDEGQVLTDEIARPEIDLLLYAEKPQREGSLGADLVDSGVRLAKSEVREADLLAVEDDAAPVLRVRQGRQVVPDDRGGAGIAEVQPGAPTQRQRQHRHGQGGAERAAREHPKEAEEGAH